MAMLQPLTARGSHKEDPRASVAPLWVAATVRPLRCSTGALASAPRWNLDADSHRPIKVLGQEPCSFLTRLLSAVEASSWSLIFQGWMLFCTASREVTQQEIAL